MNEEMRLSDAVRLAREGKARIEPIPYDELLERIEMLNHIALSAIALKLNIESGFPPTLHALNRDLALYQARFGGVVEMIGKAAVAMDENEKLGRDGQ